MNELQCPGLSSSSKGGSLFNELTVGFQSSGREGGDQPFGAPGNAEGTMFGFLPQLTVCCLSFLDDSDFFYAPLLPPLQDLHAPHLILSTDCSASHLSHTHLSKGNFPLNIGGRLGERICGIICSSWLTGVRLGKNVCTQEERCSNPCTNKSTTSL